MITFFFAILATLLFFSLLFACASLLQANKNKPKPIRVGHLVDLPPFWYEHGNQNGDQGIDYDVMQEIFRRMGLKANKDVEYIPYKKFDDVYKALGNKDIDIIIDDLWTTPARKKQYDFSIPYLYTSGIAMSFKKENGNTYKDEKVLEGKRIGVLANVPYKDWLPEYKYQSITTYKDMDDLIDAVINGKIDVAIGDYSFLDNVDETRLAKIKSILIRPLSVAMATRFEDQTLHDEINKQLKDMWNDGTLYWIKSKYLPERLIESANYSPYKNYKF
jgi:putative amino-acid transport system substrate-binding protein